MNTLDRTLTRRLGTLTATDVLGNSTTATRTVTIGAAGGVSARTLRRCWRRSRNIAGLGSCWR